MKYESLLLKALFAMSFLLVCAVMISMLRLRPIPVELAAQSVQTGISALAHSACPLPPDGVTCFRGS